MAFDPDQFLSDKKKDSTPGAFDPDAFLKSESGASGAEPAFLADIPASETTSPDVSAVPQLPVAGYGAGVGSMIQQAAMTTPLGQNIGRIAQPYATAASKVVSQYAANPMTKLAPDLVAAANMIPPPYATSQAIGATQGAYNVARNLPTAAPVNPMMQTDFGREIARRAAEESAQTRSMIQKIAASKVVQMSAPVLNTVGRVAGPVGAAMNLYQAGETARETQLGSRLAQGQGQQAEQAFRNLNVQYGDAFRNTVTPQQAQDILASGSTRDITAFGGAAFLRQRAGQ